MTSTSVSVADGFKWGVCEEARPENPPNIIAHKGGKIKRYYHGKN